MMKLDGFFGKKICVAVSGGMDSVCLLHYMKSQEKSFGYSLCAVHCEHGIRGEDSLADARFVTALCEKWEVPLYSFRENCPLRASCEKVSLETAARNFRREVFSALIKDNRADYIATAHHKNDEAETVLFRLARGASLSGVGGMSAMNGYLIRPFLRLSKSEIEEYAQEYRLECRIDATNFEKDATRNKLRLDVLPALEDAVPGAMGSLVRFAEIAKDDDDLLYAMAEDLVTITEKGVLVAFSKKKPLFRRACLLALKKLGVVRDYTLTHLERAWNLQDLDRGAKQTMLQGIETRKETDGILFYRSGTKKSNALQMDKSFAIGVFDGGRYMVSVTTLPPDQEGPWKVLRIDGDKVPQDAIFRFRQEGDFIQKFGGGTKSLKKFFNEKKVPVEEREWLPLVAQAGGLEVYAVCGLEISERLKVTETTKKILYIELQC